MFSVTAGTVGSEAAKYFSGVNASADEMGSELLEFFVEYNTNPLFKKMFTDQIEAELKDYFRRLGGTGGEQGYEQGRMVGDIAALLLTTGGLKKLMNQWKRLRTFTLKEYFTSPAAKATPALKNTVKILDAPPGVTVTGTLKATQDVKTAAKAKPLSGTFFTPGPHEVVHTPEGITIKSRQQTFGYTPDFGRYKPKPGEHYDPSTMSAVKRKQMLKEMKMPGDHAAKLDEYLSFSGDEPKMVRVVKPLTVYKVVKKGDKPSRYTGYWITEGTLRSVIKTGNAEQRLGIPLTSVGTEYEVYQMTTRTKNLKEGITIFESKIAGTEEGAYLTTGGGRQVFTPDRDKFTEPVKVKNFTYKKR